MTCFVKGGGGLDSIIIGFGPLGYRSTGSGEAWRWTGLDSDDVKSVAKEDWAQL